MSDLSNTEVYNRWRHCKKQTAKDYWYEFLLTRVKHGDKDAKQYADFINQILKAHEEAL